MYGMMLMMALSSGATAPAYDCFGGAACYGGGYYGCSGYACSGYACSGRCSGRCFGGLFGRCHCSGGFFGACSCSTACSRCFGGLFGRCHRSSYCHGYCNGYCHGYACHGYACGGTYVVGSGCCYATGVVHGGCHTTVTPAAPAAPATPEPKKEEQKKDDKPAAALENAAHVVVNLPADAKLLIDGQATTSVGEVRSFVSPALETGKDYVYHLKAEVVRDGQTVVATRQVTVRAGEITRVVIDFAASTAVAAN